MGLTFDIPVPGFQLDHASGPFGVLDLRARVSQAVVDMSALRTRKATTEAVRASELSLDDARDLITLSVARAYLQAQAARARVASTRAQVETAKATHDRAVRQQAVGLVTPLDLTQANVQMLSAQQRLISLEAAYAKQKIDLARISGLPPTDRYDLDENPPFSPGTPLPLEEALKQAFAARADLQAAEAQVRSAEFTLSAAHGQRLPMVTLNGDYGVSKAEKRSAVDTYIVAAMVSIPVWEGGRIDGQVQNAMSALNRRRAERDDLRAQIDADVRKAYVDLEAAATSVKTAELSMQLSRDTLNLAHQRFEVGVIDDVAVIRSQESMSIAQFDYIDSRLVHSLAKLDLARAIGGTAANIERFLGLAADGR
jgi:outer membrane protein TolC